MARTAWEKKKAKVHYVLAVIEEEPVESIVVLKVDLLPYVDIGAVFVPQTLTKRRLITQTGLDMVCGPGGEVCACYHNGYELLSGEETTAYDGDFFACWLEAEPQMSTSVATGGNSGSSTSPLLLRNLRSLNSLSLLPPLPKDRPCPKATGAPAPVTAFSTAPPPFQGDSRLPQRQRDLWSYLCRYDC